MKDEERERRMQEFDEVIKDTEGYVVACTYNVIFTNDITIGEVVDGIDKLKHTPLYKHRTKQVANEVGKLRKEYESKVFQICADNRWFYADANESFSEEVMNDIEILYYSIKRVFDNAGLVYSDVLARLELARTLAELACVNLDKREQDMYKSDKRLRKYSLMYMRLTKLRDAMNMLMSTFPIPSFVNVDTEECRMALNALANKLADCRIIAKAISI